MKTSPTLLSILFSFLYFISFAQTPITGLVVDDKSNEPLPYVYVKLEGIAVGTVTEADGKFSLKIPKKYEQLNLVFSYLGYKDLVISVKELKFNNANTYRMKVAATMLEEIVVKPKKLIKAKTLLKRVIANIPKNYASSPTQIDGYYRETIQENGAYIKYDDASCSYYSIPYSTKKPKWKDYLSTFNYSGLTSSSTISFAAQSLHRIHFHQNSFKEEQVKIIDSRSSADLSKRKMNANIMGGPLGLFARNRVKYQQSFLGRKKFRGFDYIVDEEQDENGKWIYVLLFHTKTTKEKLDAAANKKNDKQWGIANKHKLLQGKIYIDPDSYAVLSYECAVPNQLKPYFCGFKAMAIKHFDFKIKASYKKIGDKYFLDHIRHEDEFIYKDTIDNTVTPYIAISEFSTAKVKTNDVNPFDKKVNFSNIDANQLYDLALEYDSSFWQNYTANNSISKIKNNIRKDMELVKTLEQQFRDKHIRDENMPTPIAKKEAHSFRIHGQKYTDDYAWLKDTKAPRSNKEVMDYIYQENDYTDNHFIPLRKFQRGIFTELSSQVEKNYQSLPNKDNGYLYYLKYVGDQEHPVYYRKAVGKNKNVELLLDANENAKEKDYYTAGGIQASPNNQMISYYENTTGKDDYVLKFKILKTKQLLNDSLSNIGSMIWIDNQTILYSELDKKTFRSFKIKRHRLNTPQKNDELIYHEKDPLFSVSIGKSKSKAYIFLNIGSSTSSETWCLKTDNAFGKFTLIRAREKNHLYSLSHFKDKCYISTNKNAINYKIMTVDTTNLATAKWKELIPHRPNVLINSFELFDNYLVINEKENAQDRLRVINRKTKEEHYIKFKQDIYGIDIGYNPDTDTDSLRFIFSTFRTPETVYDYHMGTKEKTIIKKDLVPFSYSNKKIITKREWVTAKDGKKIPLTIIYNKWYAKGKRTKSKRVYMTSYGAYGSGQGIGFSRSMSTWLNRGFIYVIAHVRGGNDMGMQWYKDGKMLNKKNTFTDFIDCAQFLIDEGYAEKGSITAEGGSAGGLLMGAIANMHPDLFKVIVLDVPFVDVVNTMLDDNLPLTSGEYEEWGNPHQKKYYNYIKSYSPYDNVKAQHYPHMLFFTGLNDTRVGYWEPAKMVAKLRATKTDENLLLLKTNIHSGHGGDSGRYAQYRELAYKMALIFDLYQKDIEKEAGDN